ncbi:MAG: 2-C-methyl-D-erythritol 2,4-cyclodiphosphate synthase [Negativicutes bacterium]|nr:2-C-methyl-D-erythritol 2,4-cyclodiphosphate synthase [Negativicutes bacterium]
MWRIGCGFDVHCYQPGRDMMLCGIKIPCELGLWGHSDADAPLHALCDALLGAAGLGDIGVHFPDNDASLLNIDSALLVRRVMAMIREKGYRVGNADLTIIAQMPKIAPYREAMRCRVAELLQVSLSEVNIKATTTEGLGFTGRKEGLAAEAVVLLKRSVANNGVDGL